jgi:hypothetical protein
VRLCVRVLEAAAERARVGRGDREAEARAGSARPPRLVAAAEGLEQVRHELRRYSVAAVLDDEPEAGVGLGTDLDRRLAVAQRVQDQVRRDALECDPRS